ncbi:isopeptide-forming domain-containing fimbrial protein [Microbulbifer halophilus]|uniref:Isopeptide-forming domain-containing fimbrial protein n=1 Tax=Microbulbifer halophilus TaxID=453963 RepID=A0ABW5EFG0_9GAMM|nr:isopeptide-forming domain-containing fimbrial protein [Microbulbifer halophilus]MCW8127993.1 isopeptide-forming domain-containing fimbrial protein [Microbulbifer halophilus]
MENTTEISVTGNLIDINPDNNEDTVITEVLPLPIVTYNKTADVAAVSPGDTITYTVTVTISDGDLNEDLFVTDTLGTGLDFGAVDPGTSPEFACVAGNPFECTVPSGTTPGTYTLIYTATVNSDAEDTVDNAVTSTGGGGEEPSCDADCDLQIPLNPLLTYEKAADVSEVEVGDTITYTVTVNVADAPLTDDALFSDTLGPGLDFGTIDGATSPEFNCIAGNPFDCTLPSGTVQGSYTIAYTANVNDTASGTVDNAVTGTGGGGDDPTCSDDCDLEIPVIPPTVTYEKAADVTFVEVGDTVTYTVTVNVADADLVEDVLLTDTLGTGLDDATVTATTSAEFGDCPAGTSGNPLNCNLSAGTAPGTYTLEYTAVVNNEAEGTVDNVVTGTGGGGGEEPLCSADCDLQIPLIDPVVTYEKAADVSEVEVGDTITYTVTVNVSDADLAEDVLLTDTLGTGLDDATVTAATSAEFGDCPAGTSGNPLNCNLSAGTAPGTYTLEYTAVVNNEAEGTVDNVVTGTGGGGEEPLCSADCDLQIPLIDPVVTYEKAADVSEVEVGDTITYTVTVNIADASLSEELSLSDTLGSGLDFGAIDPGTSAEFTCVAGNPLECTVPADTTPGSYALIYTATVNSDAEDNVNNAVTSSGGGGDTPQCSGECSTQTLLVDPVVSYSKAADTALVEVGDTVTYTLTTTVSEASLTESFTLTDTMGTGLEFDSVTSAGAYTCNADNPLECTLPAGTAEGTYDLTYTAVVTDEAPNEVNNAVTGSGGGGGDPQCSSECDVTIPVAPAIVYSKSTGTSEVERGDTITYTLTTVISNGPLTAVFTLTDTLGAGLELTGVTAPGAYTCNDANPLTCTLPTGTDPGSYSVTYTALVTDEASDTVDNGVVGSGGGGGQPQCSDDCEISIPLIPGVTYSKSADTSEVAVGDTVTYTLTSTVDISSLSEEFTLTDTLGTGLEFTEVTDAAGYDCNDSNPLVCTLPAGTEPGTYALTYTAVVTDDAPDTVDNAVLGTGGGGEPQCSGDCNIEIQVAPPAIAVNKSADPASGSEVEVGQSLEYTLTVSVENSSTREDLTLVDTPDAGLTIDTLPPECALNGEDIRCTLPAGAAVGTYTFAYSTTVNSGAGDTVGNSVIASGGGGGTPDCETCEITHTVIAPEIRLAKTSNRSDIVIGDLVVYTITAENIGNRDLVNGTIEDTPPAGFTYVKNSLQVDDSDGAATVASENPLQIDGVDVAAGDVATFTYLMRVGAGVRPGVHRNQVQALSSGKPVSNLASAEVELVADPLTQDSLIFGKVFNDRDGDGWQDSALLSGVRVQGGFAPGAYVADSTRLYRGAGPEKVADASAPMLHGLAIGSIYGRSTESNSADHHQVIIRQLLDRPQLTDDFVLTSAQGFTLRMDAAGNTSVEKTGEAAMGLTAAVPHVERRIAQVADGYEVEYTIRNQGIDEGIPGVRIASVDGLIVETDRFGRYHLAGIDGGTWERGRNFILKVDPSTLPEGTEFITDNPLIRRVTPGLPVRFDFAVRMPAQEITGGGRQFSMELGEVLFAPGSSEVQTNYQPVIDKMASTVREYRGGEVIIRANGISEALAFERASAVRAKLLDRLDSKAIGNLSISLRTEANGQDALIAGLDKDCTLLGAVLFDTGETSIRTEFEPLLDKIAEQISRTGDGRVSIVGHSDKRGSYEYNAELGMRRAEAVYRALVQRLQPELHAGIRVEFANSTSAPAGVKRK